MWTEGQTDRQTDMAKVIIVFAILGICPKLIVIKIIFLPISGPFFSREGRTNRSSEDAIYRE